MQPSINENSIAENAINRDIPPVNVEKLPPTEGVPESVKEIIDSLHDLEKWEIPPANESEKH